MANNRFSIEASHVFGNEHWKASHSHPPQAPRRRRPPAAAAMLPQSPGAAPPTAAVNTTGLAVTDTVTVGILHSVTGTMAISETGSVEAEKLAIAQINAQGGVLGRKIKIIQEDGASDWPTFAEKAKKLLARTSARRCSAAGPRRRARPCCRCSSKTTACCITRPSTKAWSSRRTSSTRARKRRSRSSPASTGCNKDEGRQDLLPDRFGLHLAAHVQQDRPQAHRERPEAARSSAKSTTRSATPSSTRSSTRSSW